MREIKYRAWHKSNEEWIRVKYINFESGEINNVDYFNYEKLESDVVIMQYTGLKDANGKEIYEGDICKLVNLCEEFNGKIAKVSWNKKAPSFQYEYVGEDWKYHLSKGASKHFVVIGNIYEHPHLLKE